MSVQTFLFHYFLMVMVFTVVLNLHGITNLSFTFISLPSLALIHTRVMIIIFLSRWSCVPRASLRDMDEEKKEVRLQHLRQCVPVSTPDQTPGPSLAYSASSYKFIIMWGQVPPPTSYASATRLEPLSFRRSVG